MNDPSTLVLENPILLSKIVNYSLKYSTCTQINSIFHYESVKLIWNDTSYTSLKHLMDISTIDRLNHAIKSIHTLTLDSPTPPLPQRQLDWLYLNLNFQHLESLQLLIVSKYIGSLFLKRLFQRVEFRNDLRIRIRERSRQMPGEHLELLSFFINYFPTAELELENVSNITDVQLFSDLISQLNIKAIEYTLYIENQFDSKQLELLESIASNNTLERLSLHLIFERIDNDNSLQGGSIFSPLESFPNLLKSITSLTETHSFAQPFKIPLTITVFPSLLENLTSYKFVNMFASRVINEPAEIQLLEVFNSLSNFPLQRLGIVMYGGSGTINTSTLKTLSQLCNRRSATPLQLKLKLKLTWLSDHEINSLTQLLCNINSLNISN